MDDGSGALAAAWAEEDSCSGFQSSIGKVLEAGNVSCSGSVVAAVPPENGTSVASEYCLLHNKGFVFTLTFRCLNFDCRAA